MAKSGERMMTHDVDPGAGRLRSKLVARTREIAREVAAAHAGDVDARARFPDETFAALKRERLLSAAVPEELGGAGCGMTELGEICATLAQACGASGMVLAMHYIQVACLARHGQDSAYFRDYLRALAEHQYVLASVTSEVGTGGDTRSSICSVEVADGQLRLVKDATTVSYAEAADALLVTCRRAADAASSDQVMVFATKENFSLAKTTEWDPLGMRGTCSPGYKVTCKGPQEAIVPGAYADMSAQTMVPYSHILWSSVWYGIAADAVARASTFVRAEARRKPGTVPPMATRLAEVSVLLQGMRNNWHSVASEFDANRGSRDERDRLSTIAWALKLNNLKMGSSDLAPQIVHRALQITGILGYKNDSPFSVGRQYRDVLSASLMIANERVASKSASMLLVFKDD